MHIDPTPWANPFLGIDSFQNTVEKWPVIVGLGTSIRHMLRFPKRSQFGATNKVPETNFAVTIFRQDMSAVVQDSGLRYARFA